MLILMSFRWSKLLTLIAAGMAVFAAFSFTAPAVAHSAENAANVPEAFLLRCRARGISVERCRDGFARAKQLSRKDSAHALMSKCRLSGRNRATCQRLIDASFKSPASAKINQVKAYCLRKNIKKHQCRALIADKLGGGTDTTQRLMARCTAVGLNELECKKRLDLASRRLGR